MSIKQYAHSILHEGIETLVLPIRHPIDKKAFTYECERGTYTMVEWLLAQLGRSAELERVCGLSATIEADQIIVNLELRQPGKQMEEWLLPQYGNLKAGTVEITAKGYLCERALDTKKFSEMYVPYWQREIVGG